MSAGFQEAQSAARAALASLGGESPLVGLVLGSGLGAYVEALSDARSIAYGDVPLFPRAGVAGHAGRLWLGRVGAVPVAVLQGRVHLYEGFSPADVVFPVRTLAAMGVKAVCLTNAAGGVRESFRPGDLMRIVDHLNLTGQNPLVGPNDDARGPRFPDLSAAYDPELGLALEAAAADAQITLHDGVYAQLLGPSYETPAEVRMLRGLGADAVGMSTAFETIALRHLGIRVAGISCITNLAAGLSSAPLAHAEVAEVAARVASDFGRILNGFVARAAGLFNP